MLPDILRRFHFLFDNQQMQEREAKIRPSRQYLGDNLIRVAGRAPAKLEGSVDQLRIVCHHHAEVTKRLFSITLS